MKIVFFGNPEFCFYPLRKLNKSNYDLVSVVTSTDRKSGRGLKLVSSFVKKTALEFNIPIIEVDDIKSKEFEKKLISLEADLFVIVAFKFLPNSIICEYLSIGLSKIENISFISLILLLIDI